MLIPHVSLFKPQDGVQDCECCGRKAEIKLEYEYEYYVCADCVQQIASAFMEDICELLGICEEPK